MERLTRETRPQYQKLHRALAAARSGAWWRAFWMGSWRALVASAIALDVAVIALMLWPGSWAGPVAAGALAASLVAALVALLLLPLLRVPSIAHYTRLIDERFGGSERNEFLSAFELGGAPARTGTSPALIDALLSERVEAARRLDLDAPGRKSLGRRWAVMPAAAGGMLGLLMLVAPARFGGAIRELGHPQLPITVPVTIEVLTGNVRVEQGSNVTLQARVNGNLPAEPILEARRGAGVWRRFAAEKEAPASTFSFTIPTIESETHYRVAAGNITSPEYLIRVLEPLRILSFEFEYHYPDYSGLPNETVQAIDGSVAALRGTEVAVTFETNQPVREGQIELATGAKAKIKWVKSTRGRATFPIVQETTYNVVLERDRKSGDPRTGASRLGPYRVSASPDREPMIAILRPGEDADVPGDMRVPLTVHVADDYGLSSLHLNYSTEGNEQPVRQRLARFTGYPREATETYVWNLSALKLAPGDLVTYYVEVYDNDTVSGPKSARSRTYTLRLPTITDIYSEVEEEHREAKADLEKVHEEGVELKQELERIAREMTKFPVAKWEDKQEITQAFERQQAIREELQKLTQSLGESLAKLDNQNLVDQEVFEKVMEIQKLMEQITDPELQQAFKRLGEQLSQLDPSEVQKALRDLTMTHEDLLKKLEKTIEMLRQVELQEKMDRAVKQAEELTDKQDKINEDLEKLENHDQGSGKDEDKTPPGDKNQQGKDSQEKKDELARLTQEEETGVKNAEELAKLLDELARQIEKMNEQASKQLQQLADQSDQESPMQSNMESAKQQMSGGNPKGAKKSGQKASQNMRSLLEQLRMQQQSMMNAEMSEMAEKLRAAAHELLKVSDDEEELVGADAADPQQMAEDQLRLLEATRRVNKAIEEIARTSAMVGTDFAGILGQPMRSMENATSSYERGNVSGGRMHGYQALAQVNEAILGLLGAEDSMCQGGNCNSMKMAMQKMMGLSQSQQEVNEGTRQLMQGNRLSESGRDRLSRLAAQQAAIQKGLQDVAQGLQGQRDVLGRLDQLANEMQDVAQDMQQNRVDDRLLSRQHQILSRLLDAQHSVRKRDLGSERLSRTGQQDLPKDAVPALPEQLLSRRERLEADILRGRSDPYPPGFRELVERYYRALVKVPADDQTEPN